MTSWAALREELQRWEEAGRMATLWWRDDDAVADTPALRRLIEIAAVPIALAVIPGRLEPSLAPVIAGQARIAVMQHGYIHQNHEPADSKTSELGGSRSLEAIQADLQAGWQCLQAGGFGPQLLPVLTPPWNRVAPTAVAALPDWGFHGLSTYGPRRAAQPVAGLTEANTHLDVIAWRRGRCFIGTEKALGILVEHLQARRVGTVDATEPTGILTHHLVHDGETWDFLAHLQDSLSRHAVLRWMPAGEVFRCNGAGSDRNGS